jgi:hypothetical protein
VFKREGRVWWMVGTARKGMKRSYRQYSTTLAGARHVCRVKEKAVILGMDTAFLYF